MAIATSTAFAIASLAVTAVGSIRGGIAAKNQADFQSEVANQQAQREREVAKLKADDFRDAERRKQATSRAIQGAGGRTSGTGSSLILEQDTARTAEEQALRILQGGEINAIQLENEASLLKEKGSSAQTAGFLSAGSTVLSGAGSLFGKTPRVATGGAKTVISGGDQSLLPPRRF